MDMDKIKIPIKAALAALSQKTTHQADIDYAKTLLAEALTEIAAQDAAGAGGDNDASGAG